MGFIKNLFINVIFVLIAFLPTTILNGFCYFDIIKPYKRGFFCDDESIRMPRLDYEKISPYLLGFLCVVPATLLIFFANWMSHNYYKCKQQEHSALKLSLNDFFLLLFGLGLSMIIVDTAKFTIGRHRPNFYFSCEPKITIFDELKTKMEVECHQLPNKLRYKYIENYNCTSKIVKGYYLQDLNMSFMSGHSATIMFSAVFVSILLFQRLRNKLKSTIGRLIIALIIILEINLALFVGYTRVSDYRHHPGDVGIGLIEGACIAIFVKLFIDKTKCSEIDEFRNRNIQMSTLL